jgi:hypothetical protein
MRIYSMNNAIDNKDLLKPIQQYVAQTMLVEFQNMIHD